MSIPGVGFLTATAIIAAIGDAHVFRNGRELAAWLGLTPREYSTGGKQRLFGISKRGDCYIRKLLIHGARITLRYLKKHNDRRSAWAADLLERKGTNRAAVALANKNARVIWALIAKDEEYKKFPLAA
jgi:transposase